MSLVFTNPKLLLQILSHFEYPHLLSFWASINHPSRSQLLHNYDTIKTLYGQSLNLKRSIIDVEFRKGELEQFIDRSFHSKLTQDDLDSLAKVALDYELSRKMSRRQEEDQMYYNRFNIKVEMVYHRKIDKMA